MSYIEQTKNIVEDIKKREEKKYSFVNLKFNIETPTVIQYYKDEFRKGNFNLKKNDSFSVKSTLLKGFKTMGWASGTSNNICVYAKDYHNFPRFCMYSFKDIVKKLPFQDMLVADVTFHEIRHIIQNSGFYLSPYQYFCCRNLSDYEGLRGQIDTHFHDSLFSEIDANLYAAQEAKNYFRGNKDIEEYFDKKIGSLIFKRALYDFDTNLENYQLKSEKLGYKIGGLLPFEQYLWHQNGTFKSPKEVIASLLEEKGVHDDLNQNLLNNSSSNDFIDNLYFNIERTWPCISRFYNAVISSRSYLLNLNKDNLDDDEKELIKGAVVCSNKDAETEKMQLEYCYLTKMIDKDDYEHALNIINERIATKEKYLEKLNLKDTTSLDFQMKNNIDEIIKGSLVPEPRKKVKKITLARKAIRKAIDTVSKIRVGTVIFGMSYLLVLQYILTNVADFYFLSLGTLGAGFLASQIHKYTSNKSRK